MTDQSGPEVVRASPSPRQAGKGVGFADERHLWPAFFHHIESCRPGVVFGEQVASALAWLDLVQDDCEGAGYAFRAEDLCAAGVGAPQIRQRLFWAAYDNDERRDERPGAQRYRGRLGESTNGRWTSGVAHRDDGLGLESDEALRAGRSALGGSGAVGRLGDDDDERPQVRPEPALQSRPLRIEGSALGAASPLRGFWSGADWLWCRDSKYRPVEPGSFPLASRVPNRVGRLRAYGNAIVPQIAAEFIKEYYNGP